MVFLDELLKKLGHWLVPLRSKRSTPSSDFESGSIAAYVDNTPYTLEDLSTVLLFYSLV